MNNDLLIRPERPEDFQQIESLLDAAFEGQEESALVRKIRGSADYIPDLSLVAEQQKTIVGHIMLSYVRLHEGDRKWNVLSLGPVAVLPRYQKTGIGGRLINEALRIAEERNEALVVLLGHDTYYPRFGFEKASSRGIYPPIKDWPDANYMVRALPNYSPEMRGKVSYPPPWGIDG